MSQSAELGTANFKMSGLGGFKPKLRGHPRHDVLFNTEFGNKKTVNDIFGCHAKQRRFPERNMQLIERNIIILSIGIAHIKTNRIARADLFGIALCEEAINARILET